MKTPALFAFTLLIVALVKSIRAEAQPTQVRPQQDPMMSLMLSQPRIDIASQITATAAFEPPAVRPGEHAIYRVSFNALQDSIRWEGELPDTKLQLRPGARGQVLQMTFTNYAPRTTFNFHARPQEAGTYTVPEFTVSVYGKKVVVPASVLEVTPTAPKDEPQVLIFELTPTNLYVGQAARARLVLPGSPEGLVQGLTQVQVNGPGMVADPASARQRIEAIPRQGRNVVSYIYDLTVTPITAGRVETFVQGYAVGNRFGSGVIISSPGTASPVLPTYTLLDSEPIEVAVRPLPREGKLPGFAGAVGRFQLDTPVLSTNSLRVGDPVKLTVRVRGEGNLARLVAPPPPKVRDWQIFTAPPENSSPNQFVLAQGHATFTYTLIPLTTALERTPPIPFSYFDVEKRAYADLTIPPVPVRVAESARPADLRVVQKAAAVEAKSEEKPLALSGLARTPGITAASLVPVQQRAWFPLVQLAPAAAFIGLWGWDRRRRFMETHPQLVLRRRARRRLHREWRAARRAAGVRDGGAFTAHAIESMRVACAPHYPAEPRALVCSDVLGQLPQSDQEGRLGVAVRHFFAVSDASRFATNPVNVGELLGRQADLDEILQHLEAKLS